MTKKIHTHILSGMVSHHELKKLLADPFVRLDITCLHNEWNISGDIACTLVNRAFSVDLEHTKYAHKIMLPNATYLHGEYLIEADSIVAPNLSRMLTPALEKIDILSAPMLSASHLNKLRRAGYLHVFQIGDCNLPQLLEAEILYVVENTKLSLPIAQKIGTLYGANLAYLDAPQLEELGGVVAEHLKFMNAPLKRLGNALVPSFNINSSPVRAQLSFQYGALSLKRPQP